jgi:hypothetical protein
MEDPCCANCQFFKPPSPNSINEGRCGIQLPPTLKALLWGRKEEPIRYPESASCDLHQHLDRRL